VYGSFLTDFCYSILIGQHQNVLISCYQMYLYYQHLGRNSKRENESLSMLSVVESHKLFLFNVFSFLENKKELSFKIWLKSKFLILNQLSIKLNSLLNKNIFVYQNTKSYCSPSKPASKPTKIYYDYAFIYILISN
jgi:hypothetical protein